MSKGVEDQDLQYEIELRKAKGLAPQIPASESARRVTRCRRLMAAEGFDVLLAYGTPYEPFWVRYLANYVHPIGIAESFVVLSTNGSDILLVDRPYAVDNAREMSWIKDVRLFPYVEYEWAVDELEKALREALRQGMKETGIIGICRQTMPTKYYDVLKKILPHAEIRDASDLLLRVIEEKSDYDIQMMKRAAAIADEAMQATLAACKEGAREYEAALIAHERVLSRGGEYTPATLRTHGPYVASGSHNMSSCRNYAYTGKKLMNGDMFLVDMGICFNGYYIDFCRTACIGEPSAEQREIYRLVSDMHASMFRTLKPGVGTKDLWDKMLEVVVGTKYYEGVTKRAWIAHGTGVRLPEPPLFFHGEPRVIKNRSFINIEPGIYFPGYNAAIEDTTLVTEEGAEFLTRTSRELHVG